MTRSPFQDDGDGIFLIPGTPPEQLDKWLSENQMAWDGVSLAPTLEKFKSECAAAFDEFKNLEAKKRDYGTSSLSPLASVRSKAGYTGPYQAECLVFVQWEDACQVVSYKIVDDVLAGLRPPPESAEAYLAELPVLIW